MELKYIDILATMKYYNVNYRIDWLDENSFQLTVNGQTLVIDQSTTGVPFPIYNGPRRKQIGEFEKTHSFRFEYKDETEPIDLVFKNETYIESIQDSYECEEGVMLFIGEKPTVNEYITDNCIRTQSSKWTAFQNKYDIHVSDTVIEKAEMTEEYNQNKFMYWIDGTIYSQYFKFHKPIELKMLNRLNVKTDSEKITISLRSLNAISKKHCGIPYIHNVIMKAVGFVKNGQNCTCDIVRWNTFKTFMGDEEEPNEVMQNDSHPHQGLYLLQLNCDQGTDKYKLGKAQDLLRRLKSTEYRNAFIVCTSMSKDIDRCERELIEEFNKKFTNVKDSDAGGFGAEMFSGNVYAMIDLFWSVCAKWR